MICISVTPESRQLAKVDMLNAARQCDLIELCLDRLIKEPDIGELLQAAKKPVLISCRRPQDGGHWKGTEEERILLLRQAIVAGPDYVELDLEIADSIPRFGKTKRVVSYTSLDESLTRIDDFFNDAATAKADIVKFTWPTQTLETAWPLLAAVSQKRKLPVVGLGLGRAGLTFSLLGRKYGSPWIYAALEKGMEAFEGQPTVHELDTIYGWRKVGPRTRFVGIAGFGVAEQTAARILNAGFDQLGLDMRCLPLDFSTFEHAAKRLDVLKIRAILVTPPLGRKMLRLAERLEDSVRQCQFTDLLLHQPDGWHAYDLLSRSALRLLESALGKTNAEDRPLKKHQTMVIGTNGLAQSLAMSIQKREGIVSIAGLDDADARNVAKTLGARFVPFAKIYDTYSEVLMLSEDSLERPGRRATLNTAILRPGITLVDVSRLPEETSFVEEAQARGCRVVGPAEIFADWVTNAFKSVTTRDLPTDAFARGLLAE